MNAPLKLPVFSACGIELEYAIVARDTLDVRPVADALLHEFAGRAASSFVEGVLGWSNELVSHVIELKNVEPSPDLELLLPGLHEEIGRANRALHKLDAQLMPAGMHPWMDPRRETRLWTQDGRDIYAAYDRIFDCRRHGYANLQSMHINLPFAGDEEFERLHAAARLVLPFIPALAASSPLVEGRASGYLDYRLEVYRSNAGGLQTICGEIVPDTALSRQQYESDVFAPMYREIAPLDPDGILQHEWLNSRGAIPRFERNAIEIRLADTQECPQADLAIAAIVTAAAKALYEERWSTLREQQAVSTKTLVELLRRSTRDAEAAAVDDAHLLRVLGIEHGNRSSAGEIWAHWLAACGAGGGDKAPACWWAPVIDGILAHGTLARRILRRLDGKLERERMREVYAELCACLVEGRVFR